MRPARILFVILLIIPFTSVLSQQYLLDFPRLSQAASVTQRIGLTDITISYHRPAVKERVIWGELVPYNKVWRSGANENTTISFTDPVSINGTNIEAGTYGLHSIPAENEWTVIISKQYTAWGSFSYDEKEDALRFKVKPQKTPFKEDLEYSFSNITPGSAQVNLSWEEITIPFKVEVDVPAVVVRELRKSMLSLPQWYWEPLYQAANYCLTNNVNIDEALVWADKSIALNKNFRNLNAKSKLLQAKGNQSEADDVKAAAMLVGTEAEVNNYGYQLLDEKKYDEAIKLFKENIEKHPDSWNTYDSLAEAYMISGDNKLAREYYTKAMNMVSDETQKEKIKKILENLK